jgi:hypothetical protein
LVSILFGSCQYLRKLLNSQKSNCHSISLPEKSNPVQKLFSATKYILLSFKPNAVIFDPLTNLIPTLSEIEIVVPGSIIRCALSKTN